MTLKHKEGEDTYERIIQTHGCYSFASNLARSFNSRKADKRCCGLLLHRKRNYLTSPSLLFSSLLLRLLFHWNFTKRNFQILMKYNPRFPCSYICVYRLYICFIQSSLPVQVPKQYLLSTYLGIEFSHTKNLIKRSTNKDSLQKKEQSKA